MLRLRQRPVLLAAAYLVAMIGVVGWIRAGYLRGDHAQDVRRALDEGTRSTAQLVAAWLEEAQRDAATASEMTGMFVEELAAPALPPARREAARARVASMLASLARRELASAMWVLDSAGNVLVASGATGEPTALERSASAAVHDLDRGTVLGPERLPGGELALGIAVPLHVIDVVGGRGPIAGTLVMRIDPSRTLFPLLESGTVRGSSAQTVLFALDGGSVVAISPLQRLRVPALGWRAPRDSTPAYVRRALAGGDTVGAFSSIGGARVIAAAVPVRGAPWALVRHVDEHEAMAPFRRQLRSEALMMVGLVGLVALVATAVSQARRAQRLVLVAESEARLAGIIGSAMDAIITVDEHERITMFNAAAVRLFGCTAAEAIGRPLETFIPERFHEGHHAGFAAFRDGDSASRVLAGPRIAARRIDGREFPFEATLSRVKVGERTLMTIIMRDTTERVRLEEQLRQAQRLEAVGRLAGGIAHDFNNLLTAIGMHGELLLHALPPGDARRADVQEIRGSVARAAALTQQLLAFSRRQVLQPRAFELNEIVAGMDKMLRRVIGEDVQMVTRLAPELPAVMADPGRIEQVVMNLALNARDAMPEGGCLTIETEAATLADPVRHALGIVPRGLYVALRVSDTGTGMDTDTVRHIFEPFFTTKPMGQGTGLGLATVYGIVEQSGGHIVVESALDAGSTFTVYLPRAGVEATPRLAPPPEFTLERARGVETILVAEDEDGVRAAVRRMLERQGYRVIAARDGEEALRLLEGHAIRVDLLLTDLVMPRVRGRELVSRARAARPGIPIIAMSGYPDGDEDADHVAALGGEVLQKPFTPEALASAVRRGLDRGAEVGKGTGNGDRGSGVGGPR